MRIEQRRLERILRTVARRVEVCIDEREEQRVRAVGHDQLLDEARRERRCLGEYSLPVFDAGAAVDLPTEPGCCRIRNVEAAVHDTCRLALQRGGADGHL